MNRKGRLGGTWKPKPISVPVVLRVYAALFGLAGVMLLIWGQAWSGQAQLARALGIGSIVAACCAAALSWVSNARAQRRSLFWFAMGHVALWLAAVLGWGWVPGLADQAVAILGGTAFVLFFLWLTAEGEFPREPFATAGVFGPPASAPVEPLRSQYEQKIRQAAAQEERNRLARELHDSIKQQIFAIQTAAATAQVRLAGDSGGAREALDQIRSASREAMTEMEVMLDQLRAEPLENTGLVAALKKLCDSIGFRTGAQVEFKLERGSRKRVIGAWARGSHFAGRAGGFGECGPPRARLPCPRLARFCRGPHGTDRPGRRLRIRSRQRFARHGHGEHARARRGAGRTSGTPQQPPGGYHGEILHSLCCPSFIVQAAISIGIEPSRYG